MYKLAAINRKFHETAEKNCIENGNSSNLEELKWAERNFE